MNLVLLGIGIFFLGGGVIPIAVSILDPLPARQNHRLVRMFRYRARKAGLRGRYDVTRPSPNLRYGTYEPADEDDRALFAAVGAGVESEAAFFAKETLWTGQRLLWGGATLLVIGGVLSVASAFA
jgi:hypothetical protein